MTTFVQELILALLRQDGPATAQSLNAMSEQSLEDVKHALFGLTTAGRVAVEYSDSGDARYCAR